MIGILRRPLIQKKAKGESCVNFGREFHDTKHQIRSIKSSICSASVCLWVSISQSSSFRLLFSNRKTSATVPWISKLSDNLKKISVALTNYLNWRRIVKTGTEIFRAKSKHVYNPFKSAFDTVMHTSKMCGVDLRTSRSYCLYPVNFL